MLMSAATRLFRRDIQTTEAITLGKATRSTRRCICGDKTRGKRIVVCSPCVGFPPYQPRRIAPIRRGHARIVPGALRNYARGITIEPSYAAARRLQRVRRGPEDLTMFEAAGIVYEDLVVARAALGRTNRGPSASSGRRA